MADALLSRMLKPVISRALKRLLGSFFDLRNKSADLEVAVLRGIIVLNDLSVLRNLAVSVPGLDLTHGHVGRLEMKIPWTSLGTEPTKVQISNISLHFTMSSLAKFDSAELKLQRLRANDVVVDALQLDEEDGEEDDEDSSTGSSTTPNSNKPASSKRNRFDQVLDNVSFSCNDVSITIQRDNRHVVELKIDSFHFETCNASGDIPFVFKRLNRDELLHRKGGCENVSLFFNNKQAVDRIPCIDFQSRELGKQRTVHVNVPTCVVLHSVQSNLQILREFTPQTAHKPRLTLKECAVKVMDSLRHKRRLWIVYYDAFRDRTRYIDLYKSKTKSQELLDLEKRLPLATVLLYRRFVHELAKRRTKRGFTLSRKGITRKKTSLEDNQALFERVAAEEYDVPESRALQWTVTLHSIKVEDYFVAATLRMDNEGEFSVNMVESKYVTFCDSPAAAITGRFGENVHFAAMRINHLGLDLSVESAVASLPTTVQLNTCLLSNDSNETRFDLMVRNGKQVDVQVMAVAGHTGFKLDLEVFLNQWVAQPRSSSSGALPQFTLSCNAPLVVSANGVEIDVWQSCHINQTSGQVKISLCGDDDKLTVLSTENGISFANGEEIVLLGDTHVTWEKQAMLKLANVIPRSAGSSSSSPPAPFPNICSDHKLQIVFLISSSPRVEFLSLSTGKGFAKRGAVFHVNESTQVLTPSSQLAVFQCMGPIEFQPNVSVKFASECQIAAQQSFWLEINDYLETQVFPVQRYLRTGSSSTAASISGLRYTANASFARVKLLVFPTAFLPSSLAEARFELDCASIQAEYGNIPAFYSNIQLANVSVTLINYNGKATEICQLKSIHYSFEVFPELLRSSTVSLPPLEVGVRKNGPFPPPRRNHVRIELSPTEELITFHASRDVLMMAKKVLQESLRDRRRVQPIVPAQAEDWHTLLFPRSKPIDFIRIEDGGDEHLSEFRRFEFVIPVAVSIAWQESDLPRINLPTGFAFTSTIKFEDTAPETLIRLACLQIDGLAVGKDLRVASLCVDRMTVGFNHDERYEVRISPMHIADITGLLQLASSLIPAASSVKAAEPLSIVSWVKSFRILPFSIIFPFFSVSIHQDALYLQSRITDESAYSLQAMVTAETTLLDPVSIQIDGMVASGTVQRSVVVSPVQINCTLYQLDVLQAYLRKLNRPSSTSSSSSTLAMSWVISLSALQLTLIAHSQPAILLYSTKLILRRIDTQLSCMMLEDDQGRSGVGVSYFNQALVRWEPLVEQIPFSTELEWEDDSKRATVEILGSLRINVSVAGVETISEVLDAAWNDFDASLTAAQVTQAQWTFCNDSGEDVELTLADTDCGLLVRAGEQASLQHPCKAISFASKLFRSLCDVPSSVGYYVFSLYPRYSATQRRMTRLVPVSLEIFASALHNGHFTIRLSSSVCVENQLELPIELLLAPRIEDDEVIGKSAILGPIAPHGGTLAIPIQCLDSRLCIRPVFPELAVDATSTASTTWWTGMDVVDLKDALLFGQCEGQGGGEFAFQVRVKETSAGRFQLVFLPQATILNALPIDLECRLGAMDRRLLKTGERGACCTGNNQSKLYFRILGSAWSAPVALDDDDGEESTTITTTIKVEDSSGKQVTLLLQRLPFHVFMVYAKAWFRNCSDVDLAYRAGENRLFTFGEGPIAGPNSQDPFKVGTLCEYLVDDEQEEWAQVVVINSFKAETYDVVLTESNCKLTNVKRNKLRKPQEYVMYNEEQNGLVQVKVNNDHTAQWCLPFSIETGEGVLMLPGSAQVTALTVSISSLYMFSNQRITVVTLANRHVVENALFADELQGLRLCVKDEAGSNVTYFDSKRKPLHVSKPAMVRFSVERIADKQVSAESSLLTRSGFCYSGAVNISQPCEEAVKIQNKRTGEMWVLKLLVEWDENNTLRIRVAKSSAAPLYMVCNKTAEHLLHYHQQANDQQHQPSQTLVERLFPGESLEFGWDFVFPSESRVLEFVMFKENGKFGIKPDELNMSVHYSHGLCIKIHLQGITKFITVEDVNMDEEDAKSELTIEEDDLSVAMETKLQLSVQSVVLSFVDSFPQEILAVHVTELQVGLAYTTQFELNMQCKYLQVDNCVLNARLPVVLWPVRANMDKFFTLTASWNVSEQMILCSFFTFQVELFDLFIDEKLLLLALRMWKECDKAVVGVMRRSPRKRRTSLPPPPTATPPAPRPSHRIFVERAHVGQISFSVTVQTLVEPFTALFPKWKGPGTIKSASEIEYAASSLRISLTDIDRATVILPEYNVQRAFASLFQFAKSVKRKYHQELLGNISRILSQEFMRIVNPIGGTIRVEEDGNQLLHGAFNTLNAASKITGTIGTGAAMLTLDSNFISSRRQLLIDEQPDGLGTGVLLAAKALSSGIVLGIAGVVYQPVVGAAESGVAGFLSGLGKGIVGVGVRPVVGVFDMVSVLFSGARSATAWLDPSEAPRRARLPRVMGGESRALEVYDFREALVQELMVKVWGVDRWLERGGDCDFVLLEEDSLVLIRVSGNVLVCIDYSDYAALLSQGKHVSLSAFNAVKPVLAWEIDGKAFASRFRVDDLDHSVVIELTHFQSSLAGGGAEGVFIGYGKAAGVVSWEEGRWVLRLPTFSTQGLNFLCTALEEILFRGPTAEAVMTGKGGGFGLSTTAIEGKCVVSGVEPDSLARRTGFQVGDVLVSFWGRKLDAEGSALHEAIQHLQVAAAREEEEKKPWLDVVVQQGTFRRKLVVRF